MTCFSLDTCTYLHSASIISPHFILQVHHGDDGATALPSAWLRLFSVGTVYACCLLCVVSVVLPRDAMLAAADRHLAGLCEYSVPGGGMFLWMRVPGLSSTWDMIMKVSGVT